jgi:hypothetical protein
MSTNILKRYLPDNFSYTSILPTSTNNSAKSGIFSGLFSKTNTSVPSASAIINGATRNHTVQSGNIGLRFLAYLLAIFIAIMVILLFVHFMITPIFILHPGDPGYIPVPGFDDGKLFWDKGLTKILPNKVLPISSAAYNYSLNLDIFIENPLQFSQHPRVFFSRGGMLKEKPSSETLLGMYERYNLVMALLPDTNDLIVSVQNSDNNMENVVISNVPVQEPFRVGVIIMEQAMEVYLNGHLAKTRKFSAPPKDITGDIEGPLGINTNIFKVRNLKIWNRILRTSEIRYAKPELASRKDFDATDMPGSSTGCPSLSNIGSDISNMGTSLGTNLSNMASNIENRLEKLSL